MVADVTAGSRTAAAPEVETEVAYNGLKALISVMVRAGAVPDTHTSRNHRRQEQNTFNQVWKPPHRRTLWVVTASFPLGFRNGLLLLLLLPRRDRISGSLQAESFPGRRWWRRRAMRSWCVSQDAIERGCFPRAQCCLS